MSCVLDINNVVTELAKGPIIPIPGLTNNETAGILAAVGVTVNQPPDEISALGLGSYGLKPEDLQLIGLAKKGFLLNVNSLECSAIYTGKNNVNSASALLEKEAAQQNAMNEAILENMANLKAQGVVTDGMSAEEIALLAGASAKYSPADVKANMVTDAFGKLTGFLDVGMNALGALAAGAALLAKIKDADILGKLKGLGATIASLPALAVDTIDTADIDAEQDKLVGVSLLPSVSDATASASTVASGLASQVTDSISIPDYLS